MGESYESSKNTEHWASFGRGEWPNRQIGGRNWWDGRCMWKVCLQPLAKSWCWEQAWYGADFIERIKQWRNQGAYIRKVRDVHYPGRGVAIRVLVRVISIRKQLRATLTWQCEIMVILMLMYWLPLPIVLSIDIFGQFYLYYDSQYIHNPRLEGGFCRMWTRSTEWVFL